MCWPTGSHLIHLTCLTSVVLYANGVHLSAVLENTALAQGIRCEPLGEHIIPWTCAVLYHTARKWTPFVYSHTTVQNFQLWSMCVQSIDMTNDNKVVNSRRSVNSIPRSLAIQCLYKLCSTTEYVTGWYRHTSHSENTALAQGIRCEPLGEHIIPWTCAVLYHTARKWTPFVYSHTTVQNFQLWSMCVQSIDMTNDNKVVNSRRSVNSIPRSLAIQCLYKLCSTTEYVTGWYRHTSHSENTASECENIPIQHTI